MQDQNKTQSPADFQREMQADLARMYTELKKTLKPMSKNELIRYIGAVLIDNYTLKMQLDALSKAEQAATEANNAKAGSNE